QVIVAAKTAGTGGNSISLSSSASNLTWTSGSLVNGSDGLTTGANFPYWSGSAAASTTQLASNLNDAINRAGNGDSVGVSSSWTIGNSFLIVSATTAGTAGNDIAVSSLLSGFLWTNSHLIGGTGTGLCPGNPVVTWSYDTHTGAGGPVTTSPILSLDGTKVAFVESLSTGSVLHILRPNTAAINGTGTEGTVGLPVAPSTVTSDRKSVV